MVKILINCKFQLIKPLLLQLVYMKLSLTILLLFVFFNEYSNAQIGVPLFKNYPGVKFVFRIDQTFPGDKCQFFLKNVLILWVFVWFGKFSPPGHNIYISITFFSSNYLVLPSFPGDQILLKFTFKNRSKFSRRSSCLEQIFQLNFP